MDAGPLPSFPNLPNATVYVSPGNPGLCGQVGAGSCILPFEQTFYALPAVLCSAVHCAIGPSLDPVCRCPPRPSTLPPPMKHWGPWRPALPRQHQAAAGEGRALEQWWEASLGAWLVQVRMHVCMHGRGKHDGVLGSARHMHVRGFAPCMDEDKK